MSASQPPKNFITDSKSPLLPMFVMMIVSALIVAFGTPRGDASTQRLVPTPTAPVVAVADTPATLVPTMVATPEDHRMLMMMGLEQVSSTDVEAGQRLFGTSCSACHGFDARGISGLGKPMVDSDFVDGLNDTELVHFLTVGRAASDPLNTTGMQMPARGGNSSITDEQLAQIVAYVRSLNGATVVQDESAPPKEVLEAVRPFVPLDINAIPSDVVKPSDPGSGSVDFSALSAEDAYTWACASCHGEGIGDTTATYPLTADQATVATLTQIMTGAEPVTYTSEFVHPTGSAFAPLTLDQVNSILNLLTTP